MTREQDGARTEPRAPSRIRTALMVVACALALGAGWSVLYAIYRYLISNWQ